MVLKQKEFKAFISSPVWPREWSKQELLLFTGIVYPRLSIYSVHEGIIRLQNVGGAHEVLVGSGQSAGRGMAWFHPLHPLWA